MNMVRNIPAWLVKPPIIALLAMLFVGLSGTQVRAQSMAQAQDAGQDTATENSPAGTWDMMEFETKFWGRPLTSWRLVPTGEGSWVQAMPGEVSAGQANTLVFHEINIGEEGYRQIADIFGRLPEIAPDFSTCTNFLTDQPYGTVRFTRGATTTEIAWNAGCMDEGYAAFLETLKAADTQMREWGLGSQILRTEKAD